MGTHRIASHAAPREPLSAVASLRAATWPAHQRLEMRLDVKARFSALAPYRTHLGQLWGFCIAFEQQWGRDTFGTALPDYESRRKVPLLARDLRAIGADDAEISMLPRCGAVPDCRDRATAFGCAYVLEGATLGGRTLLPRVQSQLGLTAASGASFLASYGEETAARWRSFGAALDAWCVVPERRDAAAAAAIATFDALEAWLCGARP